MSFEQFRVRFNNYKYTIFEKTTVNGSYIRFNETKQILHIFEIGF